MQKSPLLIPGVRTTILPWKSVFAAFLCLMAIGPAGCGGATTCTDICGLEDLGQMVVDNGAAQDAAVYDTAADYDTNILEDAAWADGYLIADHGAGPEGVVDEVYAGDVPADDGRWLADNALLDGYNGDWYVYGPGTPFVEVYAEYAQFSWSQTCSGVGEPIPSVMVQMAHVPVADLQTWIDSIASHIRLTRLSDDSLVAATVNVVEVPLCDVGGCRNPGMARWDVQVVPDDAIADDWYRIGMTGVPEPVASAVTANKSLRFRTGHDARVGMFRFQAQPGDNQGAFNIVFTELMHSPTLADFPTLRVAQGASSSLACDFYTDDTMWLGNGQPQFGVRSCTGLDITQPFTIFLGGTLMTVDGKKLQPDGGEYQVNVLPANWGAPCVDIWSCNEIPVP